MGCARLRPVCPAASSIFFMLSHKKILVMGMIFAIIAA
jgi:hypothetical protein